MKNKAINWSKYLNESLSYQWRAWIHRILETKCLALKEVLCKDQYWNFPRFGSHPWDYVPIGSIVDIWLFLPSPNEWQWILKANFQGGIKVGLSTQRPCYIINKCQNIPEETSFRDIVVVHTIGCLLVRQSFMLLYSFRQNSDFVQILDYHVFQRKMSLS